MPTPIDTVLADELLAGQLNLMRYEATVRARVLALLMKMQSEALELLKKEDLTAFNKQRTQTLLKQLNTVINRYYEAASAELGTAMLGAGKVASVQTAKALELAGYAQLGAGLPTEAFLARLVTSTLINGAPSAMWWMKQSADTSFRFANAVRLGIAQGDTNEQIVKRIAGSPKQGVPGAIDISRSNARSLVHTAIQAVSNESRLEAFRKNSDVIDHLDWLATLDGSTCPTICGPRDLQQYTLEDDPPQPIGHTLPWNGGPGCIHFGCRCIITAGRKTFKQLGVNLKEPKKGSRASIAGPVNAGTSFEQFLSRRGTEFQEKVLGAGRAELWRKKKLTLTQLLDLSGNPLSLKQLQAKYGG